MDWIKRIVVAFIRFVGILMIFGLLTGSLFWLRPKGAVQDARVIFMGTEEDADCAILLSRDRCVVIDTGEEEDAEQILSCLKSYGVSRIDLMVLTHPDKDHIGGAPAILDEIEVELVIAPYYAQENERYVALQDKISSMGVHFLTPSRNREFYYGDLRIRVFPPDDLMYEKDNDYSLITLVEHGKVRMLFMGDAEKKRIQEAGAYRFDQVELYKVPHHGRDSGAGADLIERLQPKAAVVTAQEAEPEIKAALGGAGAKVYHTVPGNDVVFRSDGSVLTEDADQTEADHTESEGGIVAGL